MFLEIFPLPRVSLEKAVNGSGTGDSVLELLAWRGGAFAAQVEEEGEGSRPRRGLGTEGAFERGCTPCT